jgi:NAD(P)-dependent dehydrogenase (short-subunit alcohol dehydrogenase family)
MNAAIRPLAVVTGASSGIGLELARECAKNGFDLVIAADRPLGAERGPDPHHGVDCGLCPAHSRRSITAQRRSSTRFRGRCPNNLR